MTVIHDNDVNLAAVAEGTHGAAQHTSDYALLWLDRRRLGWIDGGSGRWSGGSGWRLGADLVIAHLHQTGFVRPPVIMSTLTADGVLPGAIGLRYE